MFVKEEQPLNAPSPIVVNPSGKVIFVKEEQELNADSPIVVNPSGKVMFVKEEQHASIISWLSVLYALNGRKETVWILFRYEKVKI